MSTLRNLLLIVFCISLTGCAVAGDAEYIGKFTPDAEYVLSGQLHRDLPPLPEVPYNLNSPGFDASRLSDVPPAGVHPRVVLSPEDLDKIRATYQKGDAANQVFRITVADIRNKAEHQTPYRNDYTNAPWLAINAVGCKLLLAHIDNDEAAGRKAVELVMEHARFLEVMIEILNTHEESKVWKDNFYYFSRTGLRVGGVPYVEAYHQGGRENVRQLAKQSIEFTQHDFQYAYTSLGMEYDYGHRFMTDQERDYVRGIIAGATYGKYTTGMELPGHMFINNHMSMGAEFLTLTLAIEGEEGYDARIIREYTPRLVDKMTYDISPDGVLFENVKGFIPIYPIWAAGRRGDRNLLRHSHLLAMMTAKVQNTQNLFGRYISRARGRAGAKLPEVGEGYKEQRFWSVGTGSGPGGDASFFWNWLLRYLYPDDNVMDYAYQLTLCTQNYDMYDGIKEVKGAADGFNYGGKIHYNNRSMSDLMLLTVCEDEGVMIKNPDELPEHITDMPLAWSDLRRGLGVGRSSWDKDATFVHYECRSDTYHGGHETPEYGDFTLSADGVLWSPYTGAYMDCYFRNMVLIDGMAGMYAHALGKMMAVNDNEHGVTFVSDATFGYNWRMTGGIIDLDHPCIDTPFLAGWKEAGYAASRTTEISPNPVMREFYEGFSHLDWGPWHGENRGPSLLRQWNDVANVFRTLHLVRGEHPYIVIVDDVKKDDEVHQYDWCLNLIGEAVLVNADSVTRNRNLSKGTEGAIGTDLLITMADAKNQREVRGVFGGAVMHVSAKPQKGDPMLLVRVLWRNTNFAYPLPSLEEAWKFKRVKIPAIAVEPEFKVLVYPHRYGDPMPITKWNEDRSELQVRIDKQEDVFTFGKTDRGRTVFAQQRDEKIVCRSNEPTAMPQINTPQAWIPDENMPEASQTVLFADEVNVDLSMPALGTVIHYTLDGSEPDENSPIYTGDLVLKKSATLKACAKPAYWPFSDKAMSDTLTVNYQKQSPLPSVGTPASVQKGLLTCDVYEIKRTLYNETGHFTGKKVMLPELDQYQPLAGLVTEGFVIPALQPQAPTEKASGGYYRYRGFITAETTGVYSFKINSCGPLRLTIGDRQVINVVLPYGLSQKDRAGDVVLAAGTHPFEFIVTDPVFWKGEIEEPYEISVSMLSPGRDEYLPVTPAMLAVGDTGSRKPQQQPKFTLLEPLKAGEIPELTQGLACYSYDQISEVPQDFKIPSEGLEPRLMDASGKKPFAISPARMPVANNYLGRLVEYKGYIQIAEPGVYEFQLDRNGANQMTIAGHVVASNRISGRRRALPVELKPGIYAVTLGIAKGKATCMIKSPSADEFSSIGMGAWLRPTTVKTFAETSPVLLVPGTLKADGQPEFTANSKDTVIRLRNCVAGADGPKGPAIAANGKNSRLTVEGLHMPADQATVAMWVKTNKSQENNLLGPQYLGLYIRLRGEIIWTGYYRDPVASTGKVIKPGTWTHLAVRYGDETEVFVNGKFAASVVASKADYKSDCHKRDMIFFSDEIDRGVLDGEFQDVRVYNRLLTDAEIKKLSE